MPMLCEVFVLQLELSPQFGYVFRVTCKEEKNLRHTKKFTTLDTNKGGVRYKIYVALHNQRFALHCF